MNKQHKPSKIKLAKAAKNFNEGYSSICAHPVFRRMLRSVHVYRTTRNKCPSDGYAVISSTGDLHVNPEVIAEPEEWVYIIAHLLLHLAFRHFRSRTHKQEWQCACDYFVTQFLEDLKIGSPPACLKGPVGLAAKDETNLYERFCVEGLPPLRFSAAGPHPDMIVESAESVAIWRRKIRWTELFASGISDALRSAVNVAAGLEPFLGSNQNELSAAASAQRWFVSSYPLLGAMAAAFKLVEDPQVCARMDIQIAAVNYDLKEIYINKNADLNEQECRFVMAHEFLHVGLEHGKRRKGRDPYLWNIACDFVINQWLIEMGIGSVPDAGLLFDNALRGLSAEAIYDRMVTDMRKFRKLATLRGNAKFGDIIDSHGPGHAHDHRKEHDVSDLDDFYRRCMLQGLCFHEANGRGTLPASLVEEINALSQPPIPWDVQLAQWFDSHFPPVEKQRTYARPSRRQSSTPDIARPRLTFLESDAAKTFGVVLDTSGSMGRRILAQALGSIASYSMARDVSLVRVIHCDAVAYDQGYLLPEALLADNVKIRGRGGTVLQPGIDLLINAEDFPDDAPILVITDGWCDQLKIHRDHAFLIPAGEKLPFPARGPVFEISES